MTRTWPVAVAALAVLATVLLSSCGSPAPKTSAADLFREYTRSTDVKNDKFPAPDGFSSDDRIANFAAQGNAEQLRYALLAATPCEAEAEPACLPDASVRAAARGFAGSSGKLFQRSVLVKQENGSLELVTLYVARASDRTTALIDSNGATYTGGLEDFRRNNDLFSGADVILTPEGIDAVPGEGKVVAVSGHTPPNWAPWVVGGAAVVLLPVIGLVVARRRQRSRETGEPSPGAR